MFNPTADPGQLADLTLNRIDSFPAGDASSNVNPGRFVEIATDGLSVQQVQQTTTTLNPVGISVLKRAREGAGAFGITAYGVGGPSYAFGEVLPVLLSGRIFAEWKGTTQVAFVRPNIFHSSTIATDRGKVTDTATSAGAGVEITQAPAIVRLRQILPGTGNICLVDVDLPGT